MDVDQTTGDVETEPTPAVGGQTERKTADEEVDAPGGLEKLDEEVEKAKEEEAKEPAVPDAKGEAPLDKAEPQISTAAEADGPVTDADESKEATTTVDEPKEATTKADESKEAVERAPIVTQAPAEPERKQERVDNATYTLEIVGNRYNPSNYWRVLNVWP